MPLGCSQISFERFVRYYILTEYIIDSSGAGAFSSGSCYVVDGFCSPRVFYLPGIMVSV